MRLTGHEQLGLTRFVYPGGRHSRLEHQMGVVGTTLQYIRALYADRTNPVFRLLCDSKHIRALIFASAVHDMGHGAFSHYLEENESLFANCSHEAYIQAVLRGDLNAYDGYDGSDVETIQALLDSDLSTDDSHELFDDCHILIDRLLLKKSVKEEWIKTDPPYDENADKFMRLVASILDPLSSVLDNRNKENGKTPFIPDLTDRSDTTEARTWILHSILDSVLDADKLDYLRRDAEHTGVEYPDGADIDRFLQSLTIASHPPDTTSSSSEFYPTIAVNQKGVNPLESLLLARYQVFKSIYWHRVARAATTLLKELIAKYLIEVRPDSETFEERRTDLLHNFRKLDDKAALEWLFDQFEDSEYDVSNYKHSLKQREGLPEPIFDISQGELQPTFDHDDEYYKICDRIMDINDRLLQLNPDDYYNAWYHLRENVADVIQQRVNDFNETHNENDETIQLSGKNIFIDVPLKDKDQIENLYVVNRPTKLRTDRRKQSTLLVWEQPSEDSYTQTVKYDIRPFNKHSPMADEVQKGFKHWARRIRVFAWQDNQAEIIAALNHNEEKIARIIFDSLKQGFEEIQTEFLDRSTTPNTQEQLN